MTYLVFSAWIVSLVLVMGELDTLFSHRLFRRYGISVPDTHWSLPVISTAMLPGVGQFLNGQPIKAVLIFLWPFLTVFKNPIPPPWQLMLLKTPMYLFSWWIIAVCDALAVSLLRHRAQARLDEADAREARASGRSVQMADFLNKRNQKG